MKKVFIFLAGAAVGSIVTWKVLEKRYKDLADEEIESVREMYKNRNLEENSESVDIEDEDEEDKLEELQTSQNKIENIQIINNNNYNLPDVPEQKWLEEEDDSEGETTVKINNGPEVEPPYTITETEYGEFGNEEITLVYYADDILADEDDNIITDPESVIGDALDEFAEDLYLERIYVRDSAKEIDYIILKSEKRYTDIYGKNKEE